MHWRWGSLNGGIGGGIGLDCENVCIGVVECVNGGLEFYMLN